jgi:membrane protein required for colicin V production
VQWIDWAILIAIGLSTVLSLWRGFVREAISLAGWVIAFFAARFFYLSLAPVFSDSIASEPLRRALAWLIIFLAVLLLCALLAWLLSSAIEKIGLSAPDRLLGMVFGFLRGIALCVLLVLFMKAFTRLPEESWWRKATLIPPMETVGEWFLDAWNDSDLKRL